MENQRLDRSQLNPSPSGAALGTFVVAGTLAEPLAEFLGLLHGDFLLGAPRIGALVVEQGYSHHRLLRIEKRLQ
jgi:hypothetical protein